MIAVDCQCGNVVKVADRLAGKVGRCPNCGEPVRIPVPQPARQAQVPSQPQPVPAEPTPPAAEDIELLAVAADPMAPVAAPRVPARDAALPGGRSSISPGARNVFQIIAGTFLLTTLFLPWMITEDRVLMSWDIMENLPTSFIVFLIVAWMVGAGAIAVGCTLKDPAAAISFAGAGGLGVLFLVVAFAGVAFLLADLAWLFGGRGASGVKILIVLVVLYFVLFLCWLTATHAHAQVRGRLPVQIAQGLTSGLLIVIEIVLIIVLASYGGSSWPRRDPAAAEVVWAILFLLIRLGGYVLALVDAAVPARKPTLSHLALAMLYGALACRLLYVLVDASTKADSPDLILPVLNFLLIIVPLALLLCSGAVRCIYYAAKRMPVATPVGRLSAEPLPEAPRVPASDVEVRLRELREMRERNTITHEEFVQMRQKILGEM